MNVEIEKILIDGEPIGKCNDIILVDDFDQDGAPDIVLGGKLYPYNEDNAPADYPHLCWYRYPEWQRLPIGTGDLEAGGVTCDLTGNGYPDVIAGEQGGGKKLFWWENPGPDGWVKPWKRRLITDSFERYHDQQVADIDGDGKPELLVLSQNVKQFFYFDIPEDPTVEPWPASCCHMISDDLHTEGIQVADLDNDGKMEIIAGHHVFSMDDDDPTKPWKLRRLLEELDAARVAIADISGNGYKDIVFAEAEKPNAQLLWVEGPDYTKVHSLGENYFHLHTLDCADFSGNGASDIIVAEMSLDQNKEPKVFLFLNDGKGNLEKHVFINPCGCHEGKLIRLPGEKCPSLIVKPYAPHNKVELWKFKIS